jgi:excisionase family DNA binding protein
MARRNDHDLVESDRSMTAQWTAPKSRTAQPTAGSIEQLVEAAVIRAVERLLAPYLVRLADPEPLVYTVSQAAAVLQVSPDTVSRLIRRGVLDRVPHIDGKQLIPKRSLEDLVAGGSISDVEECVKTGVSSLPALRRRRTSGP